MSRPEIAVLNPGAELGGAEFSLLELIKRLQTEYRFHLVLPAEGPLGSLAEEAGAEAHILPWPVAITRVGERGKGLRPWALGRAAGCVPGLVHSLSRLIRRLQVSAIITNGIKSHLLGTLAVMHRKIPLVWFLRESLEGRLLSRRLLRALSARCDAAVCVSHFLAEEMRASFASSLPLHVLYNIVDLDRFRPGLPLPADLHKPAGEIWFGVVGALTKIKGQDLFLRAAANIAGQTPGARFLLIGGNGYATERMDSFSRSLSQLASECGLGERVRFLGFRRDVAPILSNLDVLVQPNRGPEGLGRSVLEAMACAVPVIAADRWGPRELISHGINGLKFPPEDVAELSAHMLRLAIDANLREQYGNNGRKWVETNLRPETLAARFDGVLRAVMGSPAATIPSHPEVSLL